VTEKEIHYPAELTFKVIFRNNRTGSDDIRLLLTEKGIAGTVTSRESSGGKFVSYTVTGVYRSGEALDTVCGSITRLEGFMSMF